MTKTIHYLHDYQAPLFQIGQVDLTFELDDEETIVTNSMSVKKLDPNQKNLTLNGEDLELISVMINGDSAAYSLNEESLIIQEVPNTFELVVKNKISPIRNTKLEGLYKSGDIFCSQNEPQGFRRITYFLDRPDVMTKYRTKIIADKKSYPYLLSNGNLIDQGELDHNLHYTVWEDPFLKPSYLFALVAGDFDSIQDRFTTMSGREIDLIIYSEKGYGERLWFAMESLKKSMKWDEERFGREYDLDCFMIVAVDSFNMGAMENKGLNIFNTACLLADPKTTTDDTFVNVERVVAHEYFHNWSGNRITLRDWFQLTLKEGLTVFRDQEFTADMRNRDVKRIQEVISLRNRQFPEDSGPTAHPIQPDSYIEINNFYTPTVYEKGAEIIRMIHTLLGEKTFRKSMDEYFHSYDGQAITTEHFVGVMERTSGRDFSQFRRWYKQKGTPTLHVSWKQEENAQKFRLIIKQDYKKDEKQDPYHFPFSFGLIDEEGNEVLSELLEVTEESQEFVFENVPTNVTPSLNRQFSVPAYLHAPLDSKSLAHLMKYDKDCFVRWESAQQFSGHILHGNAEDSLKEEYFTAFQTVLESAEDPLLKSYLLQLPSETDLANEQNPIEIDRNHSLREELKKEIAKRFTPQLIKQIDACLIDQEYEPSNEQIGLRRLALILLTYLSYEHYERLYEEFQKATNMTLQYHTLNLLAQEDSPLAQKALDHFFAEWKHDPLALNKWFAVQAGSRRRGTIEKVSELLEHPSFDWTLPNMHKALIGTFIENHHQFHDPSGKGYEVLENVVDRLDGINPLIAGRMAIGFRKINRLDEVRKEKMAQSIHRLLKKESLSKDVYEILHKSLTSI